MAQDAEVEEALALLDELSTKSSESGLSEDTCQALFGSSCPEALRKKINISITEELYNEKDEIDTESRNNTENEETLIERVDSKSQSIIYFQDDPEKHESHSDENDDLEIIYDAEAIKEYSVEDIYSLKEFTEQNSDDVNPHGDQANMENASNESKPDNNEAEEENQLKDQIIHPINSNVTFDDQRDDLNIINNDEISKDSKISKINQATSNIVVQESQKINSDSVKRSIGSGDYTLSVDNTQQTSTIITLNSDQSIKTRIQSSRSQDTNSDQISCDGSKSDDDGEESSSEYCTCRTRHNLKHDKMKSKKYNRMINIKYVSDDDSLNSGKSKKKSFTFRRFPSDQQPKLSVNNKNVQTSRIVLDKRIMYKETEYPEILKQYSERKDIKNDSRCCYVNRHESNGDHIQIKYPKSFKNSVSPIISTSTSDDKLSAIKPGCFEQLSMNLTMRGRVKEVVNKLENRQKPNGKYCNKGPAYIRSPAQRTRANLGCNDIKDKYSFDNYCHCNKYM